MKPLLFALAIVFGGVIVTFSLLSALSVPKEIAGSASSIFLGAISYVHQQLDRRSKRPIPAFSKQEVVSLEGFVLPGTVVLCYGFLLGFAALQLPSAIGGLVAALSETQESDAMRIMMVTAIPLQLFFGYLVARWIGARSNNNGIWLVLIVFTAVITTEHLLRLFLMSSHDRKLIGSDAPSVAWLQWVSGLIFWNVLGLLGFWRGRRVQLRRYADYLLKKVTAETRLVVLALLRDEVAAISLKSSNDSVEESSKASRSDL